MLPRHRRKKQNRAPVIFISLIVFLLALVVSIKSNELKQKRDYYVQKETELSEQIEYETKRAEEIAEYETYTKTKAYV